MSRVLFINESNSPERLGVFGFSWQEKVAKFVATRLKGTKLQDKLKSFWSAGGLNVTLINNLYREYAALMAKNYAPVGFISLPGSDGSGGQFDASTIQLAGLISNVTNVDGAIILEFFRALFVLARDGKIPFAKWNPQGYKVSTSLQKTFSTEKSVSETLSTNLKLISLLAVLGVGVYTYNQLRGKKELLKWRK